MKFIAPIRLVGFACATLALAAAQPVSVTPTRASAIYDVGETVGWNITTPLDAAPAGGYTYTIRENNATVLKSGTIKPVDGRASVEVSLPHPGMLYLELDVPGRDPLAAGAAVAPTQIQPDAPRPADFDTFWADKIKELEAIPADPVLTPGDSGVPGIEYATIRMNNIHGSHIYGQIAKPAGPGKHPAMLIMQWAGGPYPLDKSWVVDRAKEGWLALDVEPHDVPGDMPKAFYDALPAMIKQYNSIYDDERDRNYFLRMYLGDYRAADYLASRPDWDGHILVATGTSMGGQQTIAVSGLQPKITHMLALVPAGADSNAALHGRHEGYPNWNSKNPEVMKTALYFDTVNLASHIHAKALIGMGFIDNVCPAVGVWTAFNQIPGPKEAIGLVYAAHNNQSTPEALRPYNDRAEAWLKALVHGEEPTVQSAK